MPLADLFRRAPIIFLRESNRDEALYRLVCSLKESQKIDAIDPFYQAIMRREAILSTGIGMGVAIPHAKGVAYDQFFLAVGLRQEEEGIAWDAIDAVPVQIIFMIGGPAHAQEEYLTILSGITSLIKLQDLCPSLLRATSAESALALLLHSNRVR